MALGRRLYVLVALCCLLVSSALGQQAGQIVGVVTDSSGGVVPAISIKVTEVGTGFSQSTVTGEDDRFVFPNLRPTHYEISVESSGFRAFRRVGIGGQPRTVTISGLSR
jgi:hypothetical protein